MTQSKGLTIGERFRDSFVGKNVKKAITNRRTMSIRDKLLNTVLSEDQEHIKRFAQYLTGGTVDGKDITNLPQGIRDDIIASHRKGDYPEREKQIARILNKEQSDAAWFKEEQIQKDVSAGKISMGEGLKRIDQMYFKANPNYNPESNLLSTYNTQGHYNLDGKLGGGTNRTSGSIGHGQFKQNKDGSYTLRDTWDVDPASEAVDLKRSERVYTPWKSKRHPDLREGGWKAARAYDISKFLGINKDLEYNVKFSKQEVEGRKKQLSINKTTKGQ